MFGSKPAPTLKLASHTAMLERLREDMDINCGQVLDGSATTGFDWPLIDGEHAPNDLRSTLAALQALAPYRGQPLVRAVNGDPALLKQLLDIGTAELAASMGQRGRPDHPEVQQAIESAMKTIMA